MLHYLNTDFDLGLRGPAPGALRPALLRQVRELSVQAVLGASAGESVLVRAEVPGDFLDYLGRCGLVVPRLVRHPPSVFPEELRPFGWSAEAMALNRTSRCPVGHPDLECVRRVNGRSFGRLLELELDAQAGSDAAVSSRTVESPGQLEELVARGSVAGPWVLKAEHGNAGMGNRRLRQAELTDADRRWVAARLAEDAGLVLETWRERLRDWGMIFDVPFEVAGFRVHESVGTRDGAFIGALFDPAGPALGPPVEGLPAVAEHIARRLGAAGYFGPVCVDGFSWRDGEHVRVRPLVDLNARRSVTEPAWRLWRREFPERTAYYRFFNRRKLRLPATPAGVVEVLGAEGYDPRRRRGTLLATPPVMGIDGELREPGKLAVMFVGDGRAEVARLEDAFRRRFEA